MWQKTKNIFFPRVDAEVLRVMDVESVRNIYHVSLVTAIFEVFTLLSFVLTRPHFDHAAWVSIISVAYCIVICAAGCLIAVQLLHKEPISHGAASVFLVLYFMGLAVWAVWNGYRQYLREEQMLTFFAVILILVCFIPVKPLNSVVLTAGIYGGLYAALRAVDGAAGIHEMNYLVLALVSLTGMIVRYQSQIRTADRAVRLQKSNALLEHTNRHDVLTGLRNRYALNEDASGVIGRPLTAFMADINYFKEINDSYGHAVGDEVLRQAARCLEQLFPGCLCYRFGGDEFLVLDVGAKAEKRDTYEFPVSGVSSGKVLFSIGCADGAPESYDALFSLIAQADARLYEIKRITHSPAYGGHDRRTRTNS